MTFAKDSPLVSRVVPAPDHWTRNGAPVKGVTIHMAEGGGTVSWLTRNDGNSSHYVVEYSGAIVQMVDEARAAGSVNPRDIRATNDPAYTYLGETVIYGRGAVLRSIGKAAGDDPNRYVIAIETEGFAKDGPNAKQRASLKALVNDIRRRTGPQAVLGHRDFQDYKACPGHKVPWADYGGHANIRSFVPPSPLPPPEEEMPDFKAFTTPKIVAVPTGTWLYDNRGFQPAANNIQVSPGRDMPVAGKYADGSLIVGYVDTTPTEAEVPTYYVRPGLSPRDIVSSDTTHDVTLSVDGHTVYVAKV